MEVVEEDGVLRNRHDAVLGADNKAAVATILGAVRAMRSRSVGVELLFTTHEEDGLLGAHAFDRSRLRAEMGFVFDHATPIGEVIVAAPTYQKVEARFRGVAAHAGIRPEDGKSAIEAAARFVDRVPLGRLDDETTANAGRIEGGGATNVVPDSCLVELEARSHRPRPRGGGGDGDGRRRHRGGQRPGLRRGDHRRGAVPRLSPAAHVAAGRGRHARAGARTRSRSPPAAAATPTP